MKTMFEMRSRYPTLNDGFYVKTLSKQTYSIYPPFSQGVPTETGLWSVLRSRWPGAFFPLSGVHDKHDSALTRLL